MLTLILVGSYRCGETFPRKVTSEEDVEKGGLAFQRAGQNKQTLGGMNKHDLLGKQGVFQCVWRTGSMK